MDSELLRSAPS